MNELFMHFLARQHTGFAEAIEPRFQVVVAAEASHHELFKRVPLARQSVTGIRPATRRMPFGRGNVFVQEACNSRCRLFAAPFLQHA